MPSFVKFIFPLCRLVYFREHMLFGVLKNKYSHFLRTINRLTVQHLDENGNLSSFNTYHHFSNCQTNPAIAEAYLPRCSSSSFVE